MSRVAAVLAFLLPSLLAGAAEATQRTWISNVSIMSPEKLDRIEAGNVLIEDGRIALVDRGGKAAKPPGATVVDGKGKFLVPGLIDSHVHVTSLPGVGDPSRFKPEIAKAYFEQLPRSYLYYGYTTLVDLVATDQKLLDDFRHAPLHPDLMDCGPLPFANGYPMNFAPPGVRFKPWTNFVYDTKHPGNIPAEYKPEDHTPEADVARVRDSGRPCVKTFIERGFAEDRNLPVMDAETLARIRKASKDAHLLLFIHANSFESQVSAVDANADVIAHGLWNWNQFDGQPGLPSEIKAHLDRIVEKRIGYQPTIQVIGGLAALFDPDYLKMPAILKVIPASMLEWFRSPDGQWFKKVLAAPGVTDATMAERFEVPRGQVQRAVAYLASRDANLLFGTDTPSAPTYGNLPGLNGYLEMRQLQKAGMSLAQIFKAATISNARELGIDSKVGTIEAGKVANLVLLAKSPLESVEAYDSVVTVWIHGNALARDSLAIH
ncbi:MAG TPA: amidohydrolase family protein [Usitatibacter sp.]|nr:amidohydrolase family protein [Usitatibacter sp.]